MRFEQAPVSEQAEPVTLGDGRKAACSLKYYEFAVIAVQFEAAFECDWLSLASHASSWMDDADLERQARQIARRHLDKVAGGVIRPNGDWLEEDYLVVNLREFRPEAGEAPEARPSADELVAAHGQQIAQVLLGESAPLEARLVSRVLESSISYYPSDLVVIGPSATLIYDRTEEAAVTEVVIEYARTQLLEFRYYDGLMSRVWFPDVYDVLGAKRNVLLQRWTLPRRALRINRIRLEVMELAERMDNAVKFIGDAYYARLYRLAAKRIGVPDYRALVDEKIKTAGELYDYMVDQFNDARSFVLEVAVTILAVIELIAVIRGH